MDNKNEILVTIQCITYNQEKYIGKCLDGFVMQKTNFRFEAIVHDDASKDSTAKIIKEYAEKYPDIIKPIFEKENLFSKHDGSLRKVMYENTRGKYVAFCEGDDYWIDPLKLQKQVDEFESHKGMTYCFTNRIVCDEISGKCRIEKHENRIYSLKDFLSGFNPGIQSAMYLRSAYMKYFDYEKYIEVNGDRLMPTLCLMSGYARCVQEVSAVYRLTGEGISTKLSKTYTVSQWFIHSSTDFLRFHKALGFPSRNAYIKGMAPRIAAYMKHPMQFSLSKIFRYFSLYNDNNRIMVFYLMLCYSLLHIINRECLKIKDKTCKFFHWWTRKFQMTHFSSYIFNASDIINSLKQQPVLSLETSSYNFTNSATTIADATLYSDNSYIWMFFELQEHLNSKGLIMSVCSDDGVRWSKPTLALEEHCHLSFPFVFSYQGSVYMIPETSTINEVRLYKGTKYCSDFKYVKTLLSGHRFVDSVVFVKNGVLFLFTSIQHEDNSYTQKLYVSDSLSGAWEEHPHSPISTGKCCERNAGPIFERNGELFRPAQENRKYYAQNTHIFRITALSRYEYKEEPYKLDIIPAGWLGSIGGHQFSVCNFKGGTYIAVDILQRSFNLKSFINMIIKKF